MTSQEKALRDFAQFAAKLKGDEKSHAQTFVFHLNLVLADQESQGHVITAPGLPQFVRNSNTFVSEDCVQRKALGFLT
jgi:hypothetical protein